MKHYLLITLAGFLLAGCTPLPELISASTEETTVIIWDADNALSRYDSLMGTLKQKYPNTVTLAGRMNEEEMAPQLQALFDTVPQEGACLFLVATGNPSFHETWEWNMWIPQLWRTLECRGKILIADAPWGDEFLNPIKAKKAETVWVVNGLLGSLQKKLPGSLLASSCRYDEINLVSKGIDGTTKTPLFSYYFIEALLHPQADTAAEGNILYALEQAVEKTCTARQRGVVSDMEEMFFFQRSEIEREEFLHFPHPAIWNGLARKVTLGGNS